MLTEKRSTSIPEIWGGIECSFNRVRARYFDQLQYCNHYGRIEEDISQFAALGIRAMRYPVIWERLQRKKEGAIDWRSAEAGLTALQRHGITPIAGLVHHGSGPKYADFSTPEFATGLASFAAKVAEKFPWLDYYTPVNEPLTTARFAGLYGLWYPHKRNDRAFVSILLNELKGVVLAMREIRKINPDAKLVQTEDLAKIYSTPFMRYQAVFENHRRWLTYDILCGKLVPGHPLWSYFAHHVADVNDLHFFVENCCPPDILGVDYYPTSERYLDENLEKYPVDKHGHNRRHRYADVEAIRVPLQEPSGVGVLLTELWQRYKIPIAITEIHIQCDDDNQIRWFGRIRDEVIRLISEGVDIRAITTWAMLGSFGWNRLLTAEHGDYESGAFDVSNGTPVRTLLGEYISAIASDPAYVHPALSEKGWWEEESRFLFEKTTAADMEASVVSEVCLERG